MSGVIVRSGQWCFRHCRVVAAGWVAIFVLGVLASGLLSGRFAEGEGQGAIATFESIEAESVLGPPTTDVDAVGDVVGLVDDIDRDAPGVRGEVQRAADDLGRIPGVKRVQTPYTPGLNESSAKKFVSADGRAILIVVRLDDATFADAGPDEAVEAVSGQLARLADDLRAAGQTDAAVRIGGNQVLDRQESERFDADILRGEAVALPITLIVMVLIFGSLLAGLMPVATAVVSAGSALLVVLGFSATAGISADLTVVNVLALALSIDYALLLVGRYREELFDGHAPQLAVARAWATAGRTVAFSSMTIAAALCGLLLFEDPALRGIGAGGIAIAVMAMLVSLTFTAALLGIAGRRIKPAPPATHAAQPRFQFIPARAFVTIAAMVQRRPWTTVLCTGVLLLALSAPALAMTSRMSDGQSLPRSLESVRVHDEVVARFGPPPAPAVTVVARTDPATMDRWAARFAGDPAVERVKPAVASANGTAVVDFTIKGADAQSAPAKELVRRLRGDRPEGVQSWVTGDAAFLADFQQMLLDRLPYAAILSLAAIVVLLFLMTGSLVIPVKTVLTNVVSLGAMLGVMYLIFERGMLAGPLDTITVGGLDPFNVVLIMTFAFAFSVDYEVFIISRIRERVERDGNPEDVDSARDASRLRRLTELAVREGLENTGRIITSAALLMLVVFIGFATAETSITEQIGFGLAVAIFIDATIVRCLLVPASMTIMGQWNWWAPAPLKRLHRRLGLDRHPMPVEETRSTPVAETQST